jgi:four helix bundle protein
MAYIRFQDPDIYKLAEQLADVVWKIVVEWLPLSKDTLGKQIIRAVDSIGANIAEGTGRGSFQDNRRFGYIARGSLYGTQHWLRQAYRRGLLTSEQTSIIHTIIAELSPKLNAYLNSISLQMTNKK